MLNVDILMATYNGSKYIENQILSLLQQTHKNWKLYIHDDGSTDDTLKIIKKYAALDDRIFLIEDDIRGLGAGRNFLHTLSYSTSLYAIFCDQDDIWLENKIEELLKLIVEKDCIDKPILVYCDGYSLDEYGVIHLESISTNHAQNLEDFIMFNAGYQGCSIMMNKNLIDIAKSYEGYIYHHDDLVSLIAHTFGEVYFYPKQLMLYRQHSNAVTGYKDFSKPKLGGLFKNSGYVISRKHHQAKQAFYDVYKEQFIPYISHIFKIYFSYCSEEYMFKRIILVLFSPLTWGGSKFKLLAKTCLQRLFNQ